MLCNCVPGHHEIIEFSQIQSSDYSLSDALRRRLRVRPAAVNYAVNITVIDVHSSTSNLHIGKSTITQFQPQIQLVHTLTGHKKVTFGVRAVAISPSGQTLISAGRDDTIKFWNLRTGKLLRSLDADSDAVTSIAISPDGKRIVSGGISTPTMKVWDLRTFLMLDMVTNTINSRIINNS